jgi:hypothetical protein
MPGAGRPKLDKMSRPHSLTVMLTDQGKAAKALLKGQINDVCEAALIKAAEKLVKAPNQNVLKS